MVDFWKNGRDKTVVEIRRGGPGNNWAIISTQGGIMGGEVDAPSGGRKSVESIWGRGVNGEIYLGTRKTGNQERFTFNVMARIVPSLFPNGLLGDFGVHCESPCDSIIGDDIRARNRCSDVTNRTSYQYVLAFHDAHSTSTSMDNPLADETEGNDVEVKWQEAMSAGIGQAYSKMALYDIRETHTDAEINDGIYICDSEWWAVGDADSTPGYAGTNAPIFSWTTDKGETWSHQYIGALLDQDAIQVAKVGSNVVVISTGGIAYAPYEQVKDNLDNAWAVASPAGTGVYSMGVTPNGNIWYGGASGAIRKSTDGGMSSTLKTTISGAPNLQSVATEDDNLVWFAGGNGAGTNGTLVRMMNGEYKTISGHGITGATVEARVAPGRPDEVYVFGSDGTIARSKNARSVTPTWTTLTFPGSGDGSVVDVQFVGHNGDVMYIAQTNEGGTRFRMLRDLSGGAGGLDVELVNDFASAPGGVARAFAPAHPNLGLVFGTVSGTYALIGKVSHEL